MGSYRCRAYKKNGQMIILSMDAQSSAAAYKKARSWGYQPVDVRKEAQFWSFLKKPFRSLPHTELLLFLRQLAYALDAGFSLHESLQSLATDEKNSTYARLLGELQKSLAKGDAFSTALGETSVSLPEELIQWARIGETRGGLSQALLIAADILERKEKLKQKLRQSLAYPSLVLLLTLAVSMFMLFFVLPVLAQSYTQLTGALPWYMSVILGARFLLIFALLILGALSLGYYAVRKSSPAQSLRRRMLAFGEAAPLLGDLWRWSYYVSFARGFSGLLDAGVPIKDSLDLLRRQDGPSHFKKDLEEAKAALERGRPIPEALDACRFIPESARGLLRLGDRTGRLPKSLTLSADLTEERLRERLNFLAKMIEPAAILLLGGLILLVALSFFLPLLNSYQLYMR